MLSYYLSLIDDDYQRSKFEKLYLNYKDFLLKSIIKYTNDLHVAEDALQETWHIIIKNIDRIEADNEKKTKSFIYIIAKNKTLSILKKMRATSFISLDEISEQESDPKITANLEEKELVAILINKILAMPDIYRDVLYLSLMQGYSCKKIAEMLSLNINTVKSRLKKGKEIIHNFLKEEKSYDF